MPSSPPNAQGLGGDLTQITQREVDAVEIDTDEMVVRVRLARTFGTQEIAYVEDLPIGDDVTHPLLRGLRHDVTKLYERIAAAVSHRAVEHNGEMPCATCTGACCRTWLVYVTPKDQTVVPPNLVHFFDKKDPNGNVGHMRQVPWKNPLDGSIDQACAALGKDGLCTIYDKRPTICREFSPFNCDEKEEWPNVPKKRRLKVVRF
jgi:Fe-S-cluster containining protein